MGYFDHLKTQAPATPPPSTAPQRAPADGSHPYAAAIVKGELDRLDKLPRPWTPGANWDTTTFEVACKLIRVANSPWTGYTIQAAQDALMAAAPSDEKWGTKAHWKCWESAMQTVGFDQIPEPANTGREAPAVTVLADDDNQADAPARRARITWADTIEPEPVVWAWEDSDGGRIPSGSLSLAAGREGTGKSSFGIWMAAQITQGNLPGAFHGVPRKILYVAVEDSWKHTLVPRLMAAGADLSKVGRFEVVSEINEELALSLPHDNYMLESEMKAHSIALVVIDPLMSVIGSKIDTHREHEVRSALDPIVKIADRTGSVVLGIAHFNKSSGTDAASLITGSGAFKNVPRSVFGFARKESKDHDAHDDGNNLADRVMSQVKNSLGRDDLPSLSYVIESAEISTSKGVATTGKFRFAGISDQSVADVLRENRAGPEAQDERTSAKSWLIDYLQEHGGEASAKEVYRDGRAEGFSKDTLKRAKGRQVASTKSGMDGGWVWRLDAVTTLEGSTKGAKGAGNETPLPSLPSVLPSERPALLLNQERACQLCNQVPSDSASLGSTGYCLDCETSAS